MQSYCHYPGAEDGVEDTFKAICGDYIPCRYHPDRK